MTKEKRKGTDKFSGLLGKLMVRGEWGKGGG